VVKKVCAAAKKRERKVGPNVAKEKKSAPGKLPKMQLCKITKRKKRETHRSLQHRGEGERRRKERKMPD